MNRRERFLSEYYNNHYKSVHSGLLSELFLSFPHKALELGRSNYFENVLEVACGNGQHFKYIKHDFHRYIMTDVEKRNLIVPGIPVIPNGTMPEEPGTFFAIADGSALLYPSETFHRIISTCLLLHYCDPMPLIHEWVRALKPGGVIDALIPNDENLMVRIYQSLITDRKARKRGVINIDYLRAIDHQSTPHRTLTIIRNELGEFNNCQIDCYPFNKIKSDFLSLYFILRITKSD